MDWLAAMFIGVIVTLFTFPVHHAAMPLFGVPFEQLEDHIKGGMYLGLLTLYTPILHAIGRLLNTTLRHWLSKKSIAE